MTPSTPDLDTAATDNASSLFNLIWSRGMETQPFQAIKHQEAQFRQFYIEGYRAGTKAMAAVMMALGAGKETE